MDTEEWVLLAVLPLGFIAAGVIVVVAALRHRGRVLELAHKERVAMIERGMMPAELDPALADRQRLRAPLASRGRSLSAGIIVVGLGLAFMTLIGFAAQAPDEAIGIGGAIVILGAAFIVRSFFTPQSAAEPPQAPAVVPAPPGNRSLE